MAQSIPTIVGIDHGFSFPAAYFKRHRLAQDWDGFLDDFQNFWPTDQPNLYVDFLRNGRNPSGLERAGERRWLRQCETACRAKSVFHFDVQGQVAKSTHAGLPFLRQIRRALPDLHFWPFDGWKVPSGRSCVAEACPKLYAPDYPVESLTPDQRDAFATASWLRDADADGRLTAALSPDMRPPTKAIADYEGWTLGVLAPAPHPRERSLRAATPQRKLRTTDTGFVNRNGQVVVRDTGAVGSDHNQRVYQLACSACGINYGANGSDIFQRKCPRCDGGLPGLVV